MRRIPDFTRTTALVARALGLTPTELLESFRPAGAADLDGVLALRQQELARQTWWDDATYLQWRYHFGNPTQGRGEFWVLATSAGILAGVGSEEVELGGASGPCRAQFLMDILVRGDLRGSALGPWMNMALHEKYECVMVFGSNRNSNSMVTQQFAQQRHLQTYTLHLRCKDVLERRLGRGVLASLSAPLGDLALLAWRLAHRPRGLHGLRVSTVTHLDEFGPDFAGWAPVENEVRRVRSRQFLDWRALSNPRCSFAVSVAWRGNRVIGYLVSQIVLTAAGNRYLHLQDWNTAPDEHESALAALLRDALRRAAAENCSAVRTSVLHARSEQTLRKLGFVLRPNDSIPFVYSCKPTHPLSALESPQWHVNHLDGDVDQSCAPVAHALRTAQIPAGSLPGEA